MKFKTIIEPFKIKTVEPIYMTTEADRQGLIKDAFYNPFLLNSKDVMIDLLTDSGTSAMSTNQWAGIMMGDESYAGAVSFEKLKREVQDLTGFSYVLPTHQGRAAERILYGYLGGKGKIFYSNSHFDTTRANIEFTGASAIDLPTLLARDHYSDYPFKGNVDLDALESELKKSGNAVGAVILTVTNNSGGGQPVSMENARKSWELCKKYHVLLILDCSRIAENSYFIKHFEPGYKNMSYREIAREMFSYSDGTIMSAKKDALVNTGGFLALRDASLADACADLLIITEGFVTYGGLAGRDMEAMAIGLREVFDEDYLRYRITSTQYLGKHLYDMGIPILNPVGGHAVYVDAALLYPHIPPQQYPGQTLICELYVTGGIRATEIGSVMFGTYDAKKILIPASMELVRLAIPRRVYTQSHIDYVVEVFEQIKKDAHNTRGMRITKEAKYLRHLSAHFEKMPEKVK